MRRVDADGDHTVTVYRRELELPLSSAGRQGVLDEIDRRLAD